MTIDELSSKDNYSAISENTKKWPRTNNWQKYIKKYIAKYDQYIAESEEFYNKACETLRQYMREDKDFRDSLKEDMSPLDRCVAECKESYKEICEQLRQDLQEDKDFRASLREDMGPAEVLEKIKKRYEKTSGTEIMLTSQSHHSIFSFDLNQKR